MSVFISRVNRLVSKHCQYLMHEKVWHQKMVLRRKKKLSWAGIKPWIFGLCANTRTVCLVLAQVFLYTNAFQV